jgi:hypothetical protein
MTAQILPVVRQLIWHLSVFFNKTHYYTFVPIPVAVRSKAWVYGRSLAGIVSSNPSGCMDVCLL